jgi:hypothetical protein
MNLAEIKAAIGEFSSAEFAELAEFIHELDNAAWDNEIERNFSPGGKHYGSLKKIDAAIDRGLRDVADGRVHPLEEVKELLTPWISKS